MRRYVLGVATLSLLAAVTLAAAVAMPYPVARLAAVASASLVITDRHGQVLRVLPLRGGGRAQWVKLDAIAPSVIRATLAGEDHRFHEHRGVDARAMARAVTLAARHGRAISGASTITMQLVRLVEPHPRTVLGKLDEMVNALRLERAVDKATILEQYLNRAYYGNGAFGIEAAARRYFGKSAAALSLGEGTFLAVLPRAPLGYDPYHHLPLALARRSHVLGLMVERGFLTGEERARVEAEPLSIERHEPPRLAPHFVDWLLAGLPARQAGVLRTTLDLPLQRRLEAAVTAHLEDRRDRGLRQAGAVILDPATGAVRAMVGSGDYQAGEGGQVNITTAPRHPGSTLKPFVYALAIEAGETPASLAADRLASIPDYRPRRRMHERGMARYREALAGSFNVAAVDVLDQVGVATLLERLRQAGLGPLSGTAPDYGRDLALGSARVRLVDLAASYGFLVNGGRVARARALADAPVSSARLFSPEASFLVMDMLADAPARRASFGAELPLDLPFRVAAKTGTSSGFADTLTVAATREAVVAAWAGAFDGSGTKGALAMWSAAPLVRAGLLAVRDQQGAPLTLPDAPPGIVSRDVCGVTGAVPGPHCPLKRERFIAGHEPHDPCPGHGSLQLAAGRSTISSRLASQ